MMADRYHFAHHSGLSKAWLVASEPHDALSRRHLSGSEGQQLNACTLWMVHTFTVWGPIPTHRNRPTGGRTHHDTNTLTWSYACSTTGSCARKESGGFRLSVYPHMHQGSHTVEPSRGGEDAVQNRTERGRRVPRISRVTRGGGADFLIGEVMQERSPAEAHGFWKAKLGTEQGEAPSAHPELAAIAPEGGLE